MTGTLHGGRIDFPSAVVPHSQLQGVLSTEISMSSCARERSSRTMVVVTGLRGEQSQVRGRGHTTATPVARRGHCRGPPPPHAPWVTLARPEERPGDARAGFD